METLNQTTPKILTVSQLNYYVKSLLDSDQNLNTVFLSGEISNLTDHYKSGHIYLSLKDEKSVIRAVMFSGNARSLRFKPSDGMKVLVRGRVGVYEVTGQYQLYIEDMQPDGIGALTKAYEDLKNKLSKEGLFDESHKKPIPKFPKTVGVITSPTGAAVQDIRNILFRRFSSINMVLYPVLVQGESAENDLAKAVLAFNKYKAADVIIIGRGGGSIEDLWAFNSEKLARTIFKSDIPVISAVGHETDFTICDFVSDLRAPTPSVAAELAVPDKNELNEALASQRQYLGALIDSKVNNSILELKERSKTISLCSPLKEVENSLDKLLNISDDIREKANRKLEYLSESAKRDGARLEALNPVSVLNRGYCSILSNNKQVTSVKDVKVDDVIKVTVKDGNFSAKVLGE